MKTTQPNPILILAAVCSLAIALLHAAIPIAAFFFGPGVYTFFGGFNMAKAFDNGAALRAALITFGLAVIFAVWGLYALSGAGILRRLPLLRLGLLVIGGIYTLRGLQLILEIIAISQGELSEPVYFLGFSVVSLVVGILYLAGTARAWQDLNPSAPG